MSKKLIYVLGILGTIAIGTWLYSFMCCPTCCQDNPVETKSPAVLIDNAGMGDYNQFNLSGKDLNYSCHDNFRFLSNDFKNIQPINDSINNGIGLLKTYFDKNKDKLVITGYALNSEKNNSTYPNLALARANDLKNYFVSKGIASNRFELKGELRDTWKMSGDTILGNADFRIMQSEEVATEKIEDWAALKAKINANPLILYFNTGQAQINLTDEEKQKVADLSRYLDNVEGAKLNAVGHTDSAGNRETNIKLGLNRANFAKDYLAKNGIIGTKIEASSKGPDEPIADNKTANGKAKNRRTVVTLN
jgi:OmpA-OmpF porin, OOP family